MEAAADESATTPAPATVPRCRPLLHYKELSLGAVNKKIRFTSIHASENFLACGANNGSVFLYVTSLSRTDPTEAKRSFPSKYHLVKTVPPPHGANDRASVSCLTICPQQKRLVVGTIGGVVYGLQLTDYNKIGERVEFTHDFHTGFPVTCFLWDKLGMKLYSACNGGMVAQTSLRAGMSAFFGKTDTELLLKEETGIVQLDMAKYGTADILMVSSQVRVLLLNLTSANGSAVQIGTKPRQGNFGACFVTAAADEAEVTKKTNVKVFSSRPGRRVWVADPQSGTVSATLKFALGKSPSTFLQGPECQTDEAIQSRDLTINKLALFQFIHDPFGREDSFDASLLISWNSGSSVIFFLDPVAVEIVEWHLDMGTIHDLKVLNESVLVVLHGDPPKVSIVQSCSARQFLDIYAANDVKKSVKMAVEYRMNELSVLEALREQWAKQSDGSQDGDTQNLSAELDKLYENAKELDGRHRVPDLNGSTTDAPLQVIFRQRPQQQQQQAVASAAPDLFSSLSSTPKKADVGRPSDFLDLRPSPLSYRRNIYAPDGSSLEAKMIEIKDLSTSEAIVHEGHREAWMEDILEEVRKFEAYKAEHDGAMNMLPTLRGTLNNTGAAAKAITTYIPGANMISNLMDTATNVNYGARGSAMGIFGDLPGPDETLILDPIVLNMPKDVEDSHECAVLRIAMSATGDGDTSADSEVLLEAISMDIWDSKLKYISNLPLEKQLRLPDAVADEDDTSMSTSSLIANGMNHTSNHVVHDRTLSADKKSPIRKSKSAENLKIDISLAPLTLGSGEDEVQSSARRLQRLTRRSSMSPDTGRSAQRALQRHIGGGPSCDFQRKCLVRGQLASAPELDSILKREVTDLMAELQSAAATAEKSARLTRRLWPAAGITRVCGCLTNMYLFEGDLKQAQKAIKAWLACFDPSAKPEEQHQSSNTAKQKELAALKKNGGNTQGFARGEALIDGDGLPLTRNDWTLVRVMVSTYFAISAAGSALQVRPAIPDDYSVDKVRSYAFEMGIILEVNHSIVTDSAEVWTSTEAEAFVKKYGIYLNTELAAEICNRKRMGNVLNAVLDQVVSSSNMASTCDDVVNWIVEKQIHKALECLRDMNSLCLLLHVLDLLLKKCPNEAVDLCISGFPAMTPWNVERCLFGDRANLSLTVQDLLKPENTPQTTTYFRYLVRLLESHTDRVGQDAILVNRCLHLCFGGSKIIGKTFEREAEQTDPKLWLCRLLRQPDVFKYDHAIAWDLCVKNHAHQGLLELTFQTIVTSPPKSEITERELDYLVQVFTKKKELHLLEELLCRSASVCEEVARSVIEKILSHIEDAAEKGDDDLITTVVHALLSAVGPAEGMRRLSRFPLLFSASPLGTYQTIVEAHLLSRRQEEEVNVLLETMDTQVWAAYKQASKSSSVSFAPQIEAVFQLERGSMRAPLDEFKYEKWESKQSKYETELEKHRHEETHTKLRNMDNETQLFRSNSSKMNGHSVSRSFETRSSDWGGEVQLHDASCAICDLPVVIIADDNCNMEVALLPCGHAFHTVCVSDAACPVCFEAQFDSLSWLT